MGSLQILNAPTDYQLCLENICPPKSNSAAKDKDIRTKTKTILSARNGVVMEVEVEELLCGGDCSVIRAEMASTSISCLHLALCNLLAVLLSRTSKSAASSNIFFDQNYLSLLSGSKIF